jgi:HAE1 family hydrophobic/amphiphilic exporter-1
VLDRSSGERLSFSERIPSIGFRRNPWVFAFGCSFISLFQRKIGKAQFSSYTGYREHDDPKDSPCTTPCDWECASLLNGDEKVVKATLPATINSSFQGTAQAFQTSLQGMGLLMIMMIMAIVIIYIVLGILYESFIHPLTILSGLPSAGLGALVTLLIFKTDFNLYSMVGIVKKNAIMMIDFALEAQRNQGKSPAEAIYDGRLIRFRPIMMTTMSAIMGTLTIALGFGAGAEARRPLGLAVVGGLIFSQLITLYITPVIYIFLESFREKVKGWVRK